jgi:hypothetical protein
MDLRRASGACISVIAAVSLAMPSSALASRASGHGLRVTVKSLHWPCHKKYLVGTFKVTGLKHGAFQVDAMNSGNVLIHNSKAKKSAVTLKGAKLKYQFPKGEPKPTGTFTIYIEQGTRNPSPVETVTIGACKA